MDVLWNPWVAMGISVLLATLLAWIESKRKPVNERISLKPPTEPLEESVSDVSGAAVFNSEIIEEINVEDDPRKSNRRRKHNNASAKKQKRNRRRTRNRR